MDINKYKVFLGVAEKGSYTKICEEMGYTQSGISKIIISMEDEFGFPLVIRNNKGISLTEEAKRLMPYVRDIVTNAELMDDEIARIKKTETGIVRVGAFPSISNAYIPKILRRFSEMYPGIRVEVIEEHNVSLLEQWLAQGNIDIGLFSRGGKTCFDWISLKKEPYVAILKKGHPLAKERVVSVDDLFAQKLILFKPHRGEDPDIEFLDKYLTKYNPPNFTINSDQTIIEMVAEDDYVTVFPEIIAKQVSWVYDVVYRPLDDYTEREIGIALRSKSRMSPSVKKMVDCIRKNFEDMSEKSEEHK